MRVQPLPAIMDRNGGGGLLPQANMRQENNSETKVIYYLDDEDTPYSVKLPIPQENVTLRDFKSILPLPKTNCKFFFKKEDNEFGIVKEEVADDDAKLPFFKGRVVSWIVTADGSNISDGSTSQVTEVSTQRNHRYPGHHVGLRNPHAFHDRRFRSYDDSCDDTTTCTETDSTISSVCRYGKGRCHRDCGCEDTSSVFTSDVDSTSFVDSDDEDDFDEDESASRISTTTADTSVSRIHESRYRRRRRRRMPAMSDTSSISSDSTSISMNVITVTLTLDSVNFLGISLVGQPNRGIFVGSIMPGGAVALDGRIREGDMILQVNDINLERISNDDAVKILKEAAQQPGPIRLVVLKCWEPSPRGAFTLPRSDPVRPIDPGAWVAHTEAAQAEAEYPMRPGSAGTLRSNGSSLSSVADSERLLTTEKAILSIETMDMMTIAKTMGSFDSGLDIREREWLKMKFPEAFYGSGVVEWLCTHVQGFADRKEAKKYASQMLKQGYLKSPVSCSKSMKFSEQCLYTFGEAVTSCINGLSRLHIHGSHDFDGLNDRESLVSKGSGSAHSSPWHSHHQVAPTFDPILGGGHRSEVPWGTDAVHYGVFGGMPPSGGSRSFHSDHLTNGSRQSGSSSSEGERVSQLSGPLPVSAFKTFQHQPQHSMSSFGSNGISANNHQLYHPQQHQYAEPTYTISNPIPSTDKNRNGMRNGEGCEVSGTPHKLSTFSSGDRNSVPSGDGVRGHSKNLDALGSSLFDD